jgi:hypothetical protein
MIVEALPTSREDAVGVSQLVRRIPDDVAPEQALKILRALAKKGAACVESRPWGTRVQYVWWRAAA